MKGIYLTEEGKKDIEAKIAELEYIFEKEGELFSSRDSGKYHLYKEILSSATILPVYSSWEDVETFPPDNESQSEKTKELANGVIIIKHV